MTVITGRFNLAQGNGTSVADGGEPPYDDRMEERVKKLEEFVDEARAELREIDVRLTKIEARLDQTATKSDVTDAINGQIKWIVGTAVVLGGLALTVMTFVLNNAIPKAATSAAQPAPIIITVPSAALAPAAPAAPR
jgi:hypothetical protein